MHEYWKDHNETYNALRFCLAQYFKQDIRNYIGQYDTLDFYIIHDSEIPIIGINLKTKRIRIITPDEYNKVFINHITHIKCHGTNLKIGVKAI